MGWVDTNVSIVVCCRGRQCKGEVVSEFVCGFSCQMETEACSGLVCVL